MQSISFQLCQFTKNLSVIVGLLTLISSAANALETPTTISTNQTEKDDEYVFNKALLKSTSINQKALMRLSEGGNILAGIYYVDIYVNKKFIKKASIQFIETQDHKVQACFNPELIQHASIISKTQNISTEATSESCHLLDYFVDHSTYQFDLGRLRLDLNVPQSYIKQLPRGYVQPELLDEGESIGFINYVANYYHSQYNFNHNSTQQDSVYIGLNGGINIGKWQFRQQSSFSLNEYESNWSNIRSYIKRPITSLKSELSLGQLYSSGRFFSGISYNGINFSSDERMLPESVRGYAPVVQGIAQTTAKVSIRQHGKEIYQTTVSPGPFKITDLYPTNYNGDLLVIVTEADGSTSEFKVPFSAVPESLRQGALKYSIDLGRTRDIGEDSNFASLIAQYGLNNAITLNSGLRIAEGYQSAFIGSAYTAFIGAFSGEATFSRANLPHHDQVSGWMFGANYSKTFEPTNTTVALAGYRFSTDGYRDLSDILSLRQSAKDGYIYQSHTYKEKSRATLILNQSLNDWGMLYLSGSASSYRDDKPEDYQIQLGYGKTFNNGVSINLTLTRQMLSLQNNNENSDLTYLNPSNQHDMTVGAAITIPLEKTQYAKNLRLNYTNNANSNAYQTSINGQVGYFDQLLYNIGVSYDDQSEISVWNVGLTKKFSNISTGLSASKSKDYWQTAINAQGALAIHSGGVTFGPYLGDTFALIEAKGAEGATVLSGDHIKINKQGYALLPSLSPYRFNTIALNPTGMPHHTELQSGDIKVAPYAGSMVKVKFNTRQGYPVLIKSTLTTGQPVPLGSEILNEKSENLGIAGQNGQIYIRADKQAGKLRVIWGDDENDACLIHYNIPKEQLEQPLIRLKETCEIGNEK